MASSKTVMIKGVGEVIFTNSTRAKHINISIKPFEGLKVSVPLGVSYQKAIDTVNAKLPWIRRQQFNMKELELEHKAMDDEIKIDRGVARRALVGRLEALAAENGFSYNKVFIRDQKTRWGSCSKYNNISLNIKLITLPDELIDYVIAHELTHTVVKNHSNEFWARLVQVMPDALARKQELNKHGIRLL